MSKMKEMCSSLLTKIEGLCMRALVKSRISIADLGSADDESMFLIRDGLKLYAETKEACIEYAAIVDHQQDQIDKLVNLVAKQQQALDSITKSVKLQEYDIKYIVNSLIPALSPTTKKAVKEVKKEE